MGLIYKKLWVRGTKARRQALVLFDTGASDCFIRSDIAHTIGTPAKLLVPRRFEMGRGAVRVREEIEAIVTINGFRLYWHYLLISNLTEEVIIGADFFQRWKIKLDPEKEKIIIDPQRLKLKLV